jgi:hypothetical protein
MEFLNNTRKIEYFKRSSTLRDIQIKIKTYDRSI